MLQMVIKVVGFEYLSEKTDCPKINLE